jgi:hypothetical protein
MKWAAEDWTLIEEGLSQRPMFQRCLELYLE